MTGNNKRIYLDHAATTPVDPRVLRAMQPYFAGEFGNPGSLHSFGQHAIAAVDAAREVVAKALGRSVGEGFREIVFTGSATEANNLALRGVMKHAMSTFRHAESGEASLSSMHAEIPGSTGLTINRRARNDKGGEHPRIIISAIEHESVLETARDLEHDGVDVVYLPVDKNGTVSLAALREALTPSTVLISVMYGNNETGVIQPIREIAKAIREFRIQNPSSHPLLHTDAAQCFVYLPCDPDELGVDMMTLSGHKISGPKGVGALFARSLPPTSYLLHPIQTGGGQEFGLRSATENVPSIVGFAKAVELAVAGRAKNAKHVQGLKTLFLKELKRIYPKARVNGGKETLPHILSVRFPGVLAADLLVALDRRGVAVSSGSACNSRSFLPSHVLTAMGGAQAAKESIRVSFGTGTTAAEVRRALRAFAAVIPLSSKS